MDLVGGGGAVVGTAVIDSTVQPLPRAFISSRDGVSADIVADAVITQLRGHRLSMREGDLARALEARGAELVRASSLMVLGLPAEGSPAGGVDLRPIGHTLDEYGELLRRAYPPDHPDHEMMEATLEGAVTTVRGYLSGEIVGPLIPEASAEARDGDGRLVGLIVISEMPGDDEYEGSPWITDICVDPAAQGRGVGRALLGHAITTVSAQGRSTLGLAVTQGSPARPLYEALGFDERFPAWTLNLH
jgi:GNAT superfamily N-acetyltransferase